MGRWAGRGPGVHTLRGARGARKEDGIARLLSKSDVARVAGKLLANDGITVISKKIRGRGLLNWVPPI